MIYFSSDGRIDRNLNVSFAPRYSFRDITDVSPAFLTDLGVRFLMLDLDNTVAAYSEHTPSEDIAQWVMDMKSGGVELFIVSNSVRKERVDNFAEALGIGFIKGASKPSPDGILQTMDASGFLPSESAFAGDQIFTDTLAANRAGIVSIIVRPRRFTNPGLALRYGFEAPFRAMCKNKMRDSKFLIQKKYKVVGRQ